MGGIAAERDDAARAAQKPAEFWQTDGLQAFVPDVRGSYPVSDSAGHELMIESARYDQVPPECGRSDCHHAIAESSRNSPMTRALASDLGGCHPLGVF